MRKAGHRERSIRTTACHATDSAAEERSERDRTGSRCGQSRGRLVVRIVPLGLLGGLVAAVLGVIALTRGRATGATNPGQAGAGVVCGVLALAVAIVFSVRVGTSVARNTNVFTSFDNCIAKASNRTESLTASPSSQRAYVSLCRAGMLSAALQR